MIDKALALISDQIGTFLDHLPELNVSAQKKIQLSHVVKHDGSSGIPNDSLGLCLVNVEEERVNKAQVATRMSSDGNIVSVNPEIRLNLYVIIAANFGDYKTGLAFLSGVVRCFQSSNVFTHQNVPEMDTAIERLTVDLHSLSFEQQNHLWGAIGAKYIPSVMYKIRLVTIQEAQATAVTPPVSNLGILERSL